MTAHPVKKPVPAFDVAKVRADFPILARTVHGKPLVFLDNAASSQMPVGAVAFGVFVARPTKVMPAGPQPCGGSSTARAARIFQNVAQPAVCRPRLSPPPQRHTRVPRPQSMSVKRFS